MVKSTPTLFDNKADCCACGACVNICPLGAIALKEDECGFLYPCINETVCVGCGKCKTVCNFQNNVCTNIPSETFAAVTRHSKILENSASGGIFASMAKTILNLGGVVFGAEFTNDFTIRHCSVADENQLHKLQGSKYAQSNTENTYKETKELLESDKKVLYSGTPCQIDGLKGFLGKDYENLITVDIVCHGVPSNKMLKDYIAVIENSHGGKATAFTFRDKKLGWGINGSVVINEKKYKLWQSASSYFYYFLKGWIYRENCYKCKYASMHRPADITIGDFWGIEKEHPEYLKKVGWDAAKGVSLIIVNTEKGRTFFETAKENIDYELSDFNLAANHNHQLNYPTEIGNREEIISIYKEKGWNGLHKRFNEKIGFHKYSSQIKSMIPKSLKAFLKRYL